MKQIIDDVRTGAGMAGIAQDAPAVQNDELDFVDVKDAKITVIGAGGMGNNAISRLHDMGIEGADTVSINTDKNASLMADCDYSVLADVLELIPEITRHLENG